MRLFRLPRLFFLFWLLAGLCGAAGAHAEGSARLALVIGNSSWNGHRLPTSAADAGLVAQALAQDGFAVTAVADPAAVTLRHAIAGFLAKARAAGPQSTLFVYVCGLGVQYSGANYLVLTGAPIVHQAEVPTAGFPLAEVRSALAAVPAVQRIVVFDLARTSDVGAKDGAPLASGLTAPVPGGDTAVAFNAAPGSVAAVQVPPYGLYARALTEMLRTPGLTLRELFTRVRLRAAEMSGGATIPWDSGDIANEVLLPAVAGAPTPVGVQERAITEASAGELYWAAIAEDRLDGYRAFVRTFPEDRQSARLRSTIATRLEALTWSAAVATDTPPAYWTFMQRFPRGPHYVDVRRRLAALHAALAPPPRFDVFTFEGLPLPTAEEAAAVENPALAVEDAEWPQLPPPPSGLLPPPPLAFNVELAPPPLMPAGLLPVPAQLALVAPTARAPATARIEQPFAGALGLVSIDTSPEGTTIVATEGAQLLKIVTATTHGDRTILETDAAGETVSRTSTVHGDATITTVQTGPKGGILSRISTQIALGGTRTTTITDGRSQLIAEMKTDPRGVIVGLTRGPAVFDDETFAVSQPDPAPKPPSSSQTETRGLPRAAPEDKFAPVPPSSTASPANAVVPAPTAAAIDANGPTTTGSNTAVAAPTALPPRPPMPVLPPLPNPTPPPGKPPSTRDLAPPGNAAAPTAATSPSPAASRDVAPVPRLRRTKTIRSKPGRAPTKHVVPGRATRGKPHAPRRRH